MVQALNRMHGRWPTAQEDFRYVLSAFVVAPTRWIDRWGWRPLQPCERTATAPSFTPGMAVAAYPDGYALDDLGVRPGDTAV